MATAFGVEHETLRRWRHRWQEAGTEGLVSQKSGMKGPYKLTDEVRAEIAALHADGLGLRAIARALDLDPSTVHRGLPSRKVPEQAHEHGTLEPLARPSPRVSRDSRISS